MYALSLLWMARAMLRAICISGLPPVTGRQGSPLWVAMGALRFWGHEDLLLPDPNDNQRLRLYLFLFAEYDGEAEDGWSVACLPVFSVLAPQMAPNYLILTGIARDG